MTPLFILYWKWKSVSHIWLLVTPWTVHGILQARILKWGKTSTSASLTTPKSLTVDHNKLWKILQEMGIPDHFTCLLRNLCAGQEATVRTGHWTTELFQIRKGVRQGLILPPWLFNLYAEDIMWMPGWMKHKLESRWLGKILITSHMQMTSPLYQNVKN